MFSMGYDVYFKVASGWDGCLLYIYINWVVHVSSCLSQGYFRIRLPRSCGSYHPRF